jgi:hypothetical protein
VSYFTGDGRASEQPGLTAIHTIFMREHNRVADGLLSMNPTWEDERIYQEARKIVTAEYQHIAYNEFLPRILGHTAMNLYGLTLMPHGEYFKGKKLTAHLIPMMKYQSKKSRYSLRYRVF